MRTLFWLNYSSVPEINFLASHFHELNDSFLGSLSVEVLHSIPFFRIIRFKSRVKMILITSLLFVFVKIFIMHHFWNLSDSNFFQWIQLNTLFWVKFIHSTSSLDLFGITFAVVSFFQFHQYRGMLDYWTSVDYLFWQVNHQLKVSFLI
jgi:hypothetical protein